MKLCHFFTILIYFSYIFSIVKKKQKKLTYIKKQPEKSERLVCVKGSVEQNLKFFTFNYQSNLRWCTRLGIFISS